MVLQLMGEVNLAGEFRSWTIIHSQTARVINHRVRGDEDAAWRLKVCELSMMVILKERAVGGVTMTFAAFLLLLEWIEFWSMQIP